MVVTMATAQRVIDINSDIGESFGAWRMGHDELTLASVTSANIACGFHAGDPSTMRETVRTVARLNVSCGAHPCVGFADFACADVELHALPEVAFLPCDDAFLCVPAVHGGASHTHEEVGVGELDGCSVGDVVGLHRVSPFISGSLILGSV